MSWRQTLAAAAAIDPSIEVHRPALESVIETVSHGDIPDASRLRQVLGIAEESGQEAADELPPSDPPFLRALSNVVRANHDRLSQPELTAARTVLRELEPLLTSLRYVANGSPLPSGSYAAANVLARMSNPSAPDGPAGSLRCPRCGSRAVSRRYDDYNGRRLYEATCDACGLYESWFEDEEDGGKGWRRGTFRTPTMRTDRS